VAIDISVRITLVAACVGTTLMAAWVRSGAVRHAGWTAVLCTMLLMPFLPRITPEIAVPVDAPAMKWDASSVPAAPVTESGPRLTPASRISQPFFEPVPRRSLWPVVALAVYLAGLALLLTRMVVGWCAARRLIRAAEPVVTPVAGVPVYHADEIATPLIV